MMNTPRFHARFAGIQLLLMAIIAGVAYGYAFTTLSQPPAELSSFDGNVPAWLCFLGFALIALLDIGVARSLCHAFPQKGTLIKWICALRFGYAICLVIAMLPLYGLLNQSSEFWSHREGIESALNAFSSMWSHSLVLFGLHLILLAYLFIRERDLPSWLGYLLLLGGLIYSVHHGLIWCSPAYASHQAAIEQLIAFPSAIGELILAVWLIYAPKKVFAPTSVSTSVSAAD